ncbi:hypothetical protein KUA02_15720, partial [Komagataeibacter pomaceti]|nr:hypothetical protein [Novacetimonas pomaceti]
LLLQAQGVQAHRHAMRQDRQIIRSHDLSHRRNHQLTLIPNRPQKDSKDAAFLKKGGTQKLLPLPDIRCLIPHRHRTADRHFPAA